MLIKMLIILLDYLFLKKINFFEVKSNYSVLSITAIQQSDSAIYILFFIFFPIMSHHRILVIVPCAIW